MNKTLNPLGSLDVLFKELDRQLKFLSDEIDRIEKTELFNERARQHRMDPVPNETLPVRLVRSPP